MALDESAAVEKLQKLFPTGVIFADQYMKQTGLLSFEVHKIAKACGKTRAEWLSSHGFVWKETGYVEPDMRIRDVEAPVDGTDAFRIADYVFRRFPLAGEDILTQEENQLLYQSANQTVKKILMGDTHITKRDEVVLVLETIELLKSWSTDLLNREGAGTFWNYIFMQYGFHPENSEEAEKRLYARFRLAIRNTLDTYKRFFAPAGTHRYYTSLLLHALAPRQSIEALFNILFDFYVKNLDFQYVVEDISYKVFTKGMRARWDTHITKDDHLQLRSDAVFSGLQALFRERPGYMAVLADTIVKKMDALLRGDSEVTFHTERNDWDRLLYEWYHKKSSTERIHVQGERRQHKTEYVATTAERIYVQYAMVNEMVGLRFPRIRLSSVEEERPIIKITQNGILIFEDDLSVTGNDLCLTTRSRFIPLQETEYDFSQEPQVRVEILYKHDCLYRSEAKLERSYVLFDEAGNERIPKAGAAYLFAAELSTVEFIGEDGIYQLTHPGQLYRINLSEVAAAAVDGAEIFADAATASQFRHHTSQRRVSGVRIVEQGNCADIFSEPFVLMIRMPEGEPILRYQLSVDGVRYGPNRLKNSEDTYEISTAEDDGVLHRIRIIDVADDSVKYEYRYIILQNFRLSTDKQLYRSGSDMVQATVLRHGNESKAEIPLPQGAGQVDFSLPGLPYQFELDVPAVQCTFMGKNAFSAPEAVWHKDISPGEFVSLQVPEGWSGVLMLDASCVPPAPAKGQFELGNFLRSMPDLEGAKALWISLKDERGHHEKYKITTLIFTPQFLRSPLELHAGRLCWQVTDNFFGGPNPQFQITCGLPDKKELHYQASYEDRVLNESCDLPDGRHPFQVFLAGRKSVFAPSAVSQLIYQGELIAGDPRAFAFEQKEILLGDALCWDFDTDMLKTVFMKPGCGIIRDLVYQGESIASGEPVAASSYSGTLYFVDQAGNYRLFNSNPSRKGFELVNPVNLWIVNEHLLILRCATDDTVYIDNRYSTIVNRSPSVIMSYEQTGAAGPADDAGLFRVHSERGVTLVRSDKSLRGD